MSFFGSFFNAAMKEMEKNQNKYERANEKPLICQMNN